MHRQFAACVLLQEALQRRLAAVHDHLERLQTQRVHRHDGGTLPERQLVHALHKRLKLQRQTPTEITDKSDIRKRQLVHANFNNDTDITNTIFYWQLDATL